MNPKSFSVSDKEKGAQLGPFNLKPFNISYEKRRLFLDDHKMLFPREETGRSFLLGDVYCGISCSAE